MKKRYIIAGIVWMIVLTSCTAVCPGMDSELSAGADINEQSIDASSVDVREDLRYLRQMADEIEEKYYVVVLISGQCAYVDTFADYDIVTSDNEDYQTEIASEAEYIEYALEILDNVLKEYPDGFLAQLTKDGESPGLRFLLTYGIEGDISAGGLSNSCEKSHDIAFDIRLGGFETTLNHEIFHAIEDKINEEDPSIFEDDKWNGLNPQGFSYAGTFSGYSSLTEYTLTDDPSGPIYFYDPYSRTKAREDRARIFECAMCPKLRPSKELFAYEYPQQKLKFICDAIRSVFDTSTWREIPVWERLLAINSHF